MKCNEKVDLVREGATNALPGPESSLDIPLSYSSRYRFEARGGSRASGSTGLLVCLFHPHN